MRFLPVAFCILSGAAAFAGTSPPAVPDDSRQIAEQAKASFEKGDYSNAENLYGQILKNHPDNLYALSNLGVVQFRLGKLQLAQLSLDHAISVAPNDAFSHCTLGVVYYQQRMFDRAAFEFSRAVALDPKNSVAKEWLSLVNGQPQPKFIPPPVGDFETPHERSIREGSGLPQSSGEIGLSPSAF
jgi:Flp pilus assembly protein TadD